MKSMLDNLSMIDNLKSTFKYITAATFHRKKLDWETFKKTELSRCLSTFHLISLGVSLTVGAGVYAVTGEIAKNLSGPAVILSYLIAGILCIIPGLCLSELSARIPKAGSIYLYCYMVIGELPAFVAGFALLVKDIVGPAIVTKALSAYINVLAGGYFERLTISLIGEMDIPGLSRILDFLSFFILLLYTIIHVSVNSVKTIVILCSIGTIANMCCIALVVFVGLAYANFDNWKDFAPYGFEGIAAGVVSCFYAFFGFDIISASSEEVQNPAKSIPISIIVTLGIAFLAYFSVSGVITLMVPYYELTSTSAVATVFYQRNVKGMTYIVAAGVAVVLFSASFCGLIPAARYTFALAEDGMVFKCFSKVSKRNKIPVPATLFVGITVAILALLFDILSLIQMSTVYTILTFVLVEVCVIAIRYRHPSTLFINYPTEKTDLVAEKHENASWSNFCRFQNTTVVVIGLAFIIVMVSVCLGLLLHHDNIFGLRSSFYIMLSALSVILFTCCFYLSKLESFTSDLAYVVPLVPWIPVLGIVSQTYIIFTLEKIVWIKFGFSLLLCLMFYYGYSIHNNLERKSAETTDLPESKCHQKDCNK